MTIQYEFLPDDKTADELKKQNWWAAPDDRDPCPCISQFWWPYLPFQSEQHARQFAIDADIRLDRKSIPAEAIRAEYLSKIRDFMEESDKCIHANRVVFIQKYIPPRYRMPVDRIRLKNPAAFDKVQAWAPEGDRPGLVALGDTGRGKTLAVYTRLAQLHIETGLCFIALTADSLKTHILALSQSSHNQDQDEKNDPLGRVYQSCRRHTIASNPYPCDKDTLESFTNKMCRTDLLFIDDLSQAKMTPVYAERLFAIIENRTSNEKALVITVQMGKEKLVQKLAGHEDAFLDTADCIARRIEDYCQPVNFGRNT